jgi:hypothetical protein
MSQFVNLWGLLQGTVLIPGTEDSISWTLTHSGTYTTVSAYKAQFMGSVPCSFKNIVWIA